MEYIDVLTPEGKLAGTNKSKKQIHIDGDWHRAVHIWIINSKDEVLMQRRSKTKLNYPNLLDTSVAGHISSGENSLETAIREIEEEIGISMQQEELIYLGEVTQQKISNNDSYIDNEYVDIYLVEKKIKISSMKMQKSEVDDLCYVPLDTLETWVEEKNPEILEHDDEYELLFQVLKNRN